MKIKPRMVLPFLVAVLALFFFIFNINISETLQTISKTNLYLYSIAFVMAYLALAARSYRWKLLLKNMDFHAKFKDVFEIYFLSVFVNCLLPAKMGDVYRGHKLKKNYEVSMSKTVGTVFVERIVDIVFLVAMISVSGFFLFGSQLPEEIASGMKVAYLLAALLIAMLFSIRKWRKRIIGLLPGRMGGYLERFESGCSLSLERRRLKILATTLLIWSIDLVRIFIVAKAIGVDLPILVLLFILPTIALLTALPLTPAGLGAVELSVTGILVLTGLNVNVAASIAILERLLSYWSYIFFGALLYTFSKKS